MRICSYFFEDLAPAAVRPPISVAALHGRLLMALQVAWGLAAHPSVTAFAICEGDASAVPGAAAIEAAQLEAWMAAGDSVWLEPARHYWFKPALVRRHTGVRFPIVTMAHGLGYSRQVGPLIASLAAAPLAGDLVIAPSRATADVLREQCRALIAQLGLPRQPPDIAVVPYGVPRVVHTPRDAARAALGWDHRPVLLFVGRLSHQDKADFGALFEAVAQLRAASQPCHLVLAGVGSETAVELLRAHATACRVGDAEVRLNVSEVEKHLLFSGCDVFVSPSNTASESFGLTIVEAMLHGVPVVGTAWSGYSEIVRDGVDGFLVPVTWTARTAESELPFLLGSRDSLSSAVAIDPALLAQRIGWLTANVALRHQFGAEARSRAETHFLIDRVVHDLVALLAQTRAECDRSQSSVTPIPVTLARAFRRYAAGSPSTSCTEQ